MFLKLFGSQSFEIPNSRLLVEPHSGPFDSSFGASSFRLFENFHAKLVAEIMFCCPNLDDRATGYRTNCINGLNCLNSHHLVNQSSQCGPPEHTQLLKMF